MGCCAYLAPTLLLHLNLLLMVFVGGALVTGARARWDPSLYVPARELFPREFRVSAALLPALAAVLLLLAHAALLALRTRRLALRRALLYMYAGGALGVSAAQAAWAAWLYVRLARWAASPPARELQRAAALGDHLQPLLDQLAHWHPLPQRLSTLIQQEARADLPVNLHVLAAAGGVLLALQLLAALLALVSAAGTPRPPPRPRSHSSLSAATATTPLSARKGAARAVYRNGRLVLLQRPPGGWQADAGGLRVQRSAGEHLHDSNSKTEVAYFVV